MKRIHYNGHTRGARQGCAVWAGGDRKTPLPASGLPVLSTREGGTKRLKYRVSAPTSGRC